MEKPFKFHNLTFNHTLEGLLRIVSLPEALLLFGVKMRWLVSATVFLNVREMERIAVHWVPQGLASTSSHSCLLISDPL